MEIEVLYGAGVEAELVGQLHEDARGRIYFEYAEDWRRGERELSPLYLPNRTQGAVVCPSPEFSPLFGVFADVLPDWWGERLMRRYFAQSGVPWQKVSSLQKLACQGETKMGALVFRPAIEGSDFRTEMAVTIDELVADSLKNLQGDSTELMERLVRSGMSAGGAQPKAVVCLSDNFQEVMIADPAPVGFSPWLVKFDLEPDMQGGRVEYAFYLMARAAGINMKECRLLQGSGGRAHFATRRFDRGESSDGAKRIHFHSYSGLLHRPVRNGIEYSDLMSLARQLTGEQSVVEQIFRRAVFNVAAGNDDDHGRNHGFLMDSAGKWTLAPAYDLTAASNPLTSGVRAGAIDGKVMDIKRKDLLNLADSHSVRNARDSIDEVLDVLGAWPRWAKDAGLSQDAMVLNQPQLQLKA